MDKFLSSVSYSALDFEYLLDEKLQTFRRVLTDVIKLFVDKSIRPINLITVFPISKI